MNKLNLDGMDSELKARIEEGIGKSRANTIITEVFINKNWTIYVNVDTKYDGKFLFVFRQLENDELKMVFATMGKTFVPIADSEVIGLLKTSFSKDDCYQSLTDIDSELCIGEKAKQIKENNNNLLFVPFVYKTSELDILLDLNADKVVGLIDYILKSDIVIRPGLPFCLADYEGEFIELADQISNINEGNRIKRQSKLLGRVLRRKTNNKEEAQGEQI